MSKCHKLFDLSQVLREQQKEAIKQRTKIKQDPPNALKSHRKLSLLLLSATTAEDS